MTFFYFSFGDGFLIFLTYNFQRMCEFFLIFFPINVIFVDSFFSLGIGSSEEIVKNGCATENYPDAVMSPKSFGIVQTHHLYQQYLL